LPAKEVSEGACIHPYTKALLAASPRFGSHYTSERLQIIPGKVIDPVKPGTGCPFAPRCALADTSCTSAIPPLSGAGDHTVRCVKAEF